jgi:hypothetical protein
MGFYSEYLDKGMSFQALTEERKRILKQISKIRGRDVLVYAADVMKGAQGAAVALVYDDLLPVTDQLANLSGKAIDVILETGGGSGEVAEDIVRILRSKYESVAFIVPGIAKSAGTIMVMSGDEILMDDVSALGPIDAQIAFEGKQFSAEALLKGFEKIKAESDETKTLNRAYIPLLQRISPGDLQHAENALDFARVLVAEWLSRYKFKNWNKHRTHHEGADVTPAEKLARGKQIARELCDHSKWLTHGRSIRMQDLRELGLEITDYSKDQKLGEAIKRYHVLLQMMFNGSNVYKIFETPSSQIMRFIQAPVPQAGGIPALPPGATPDGIVAEVGCGRCQKKHHVQLDFDRLKPLQPGNVRYPSNDVLVCDQCGNQMNLAGLRQQAEMQMKRQVARK